MKNQKTVIISVVFTVLLLAIIGTAIVLNDKVSAASCNHKWGAWQNTGVGVHVRYCTKGCETSQSQNCDDYSSWESYGEEGHHWECSVCGAFTKPREHTFKNGKCTECDYTCNH